MRVLFLLALLLVALTNHTSAQRLSVPKVTASQPAVLKLTHPNGGEVFVAGIDTVITWEGIAPTDAVRLEYSTDNGTSWILITASATGGSYPWHVPKTPSNRCLVHIQQLVASGGQSVELLGHTSNVLSVAWSPDGTNVVTASDDYSAKIWNANTGLFLKNLTSGADPLYSVDWSSDGTRIATAGRFGNTIKIWNAATSALIRTLAGHTDIVAWVSWSPDGTKLATTSFDKTARIWDANSGAILQTLSGHTDYVYSVAWSPDGNTVATASDDKTAKTWDVNTGAVIRTFTGHTNGLACVAWHRNGKWIATASVDKTANIWDASTGAVIRTITGHSNRVSSVAWSPDGTKLATGSDDYTAKIWDANTGALQQTLIGHTYIVSCVKWSPDGMRLATSSFDLTARIWDVSGSVQSDASDATFSIVLPQPTSQNIDMGKVPVGSPRDSVVQTFVRNTGAYPFKVNEIQIVGSDATLFTVLSGTPPFTVAPNSSYPVEFRFHPLTVGAKVAKLNVITQTDTLVQNIVGEGIEPVLEVVNDVIDFGRVIVGTPKDTLKVLTIKNVGSAPLSITGTQHGGPNVTDFSTLSGGGALVITPGETIEIDLRFQPSAVGPTSGQLLFDYGGTGSPATIRLLGEGVLTGAQIQAADLTFTPLICKSQIVDTVHIVNTGGSDLQITSARITGTDQTAFALDKPFSQVTILPGSSSALAIRCAPPIIGSVTAQLELQSNSTNNELLSVTLNGTKEGADYAVNETVIDVGILCVNEAIDTTIVLTNTGTTINAISAVASGLTLSKGTITLAVAAIDTLAIHLDGRTTEGSIDEVVTLVDSICGIQKNVRLIGTIQATRLATTDLTLTALVGGQTVEDVLTIDNSSQRIATLTSLPDISPFEFVNVTLPLTIPVGGHIQLRVRYQALDTVTQQFALTITPEPCGIPTKVLIAGTGKPVIASEATLTVQQIEAYPGDEVEIPIILSKDIMLLQTGATGLEATLRFNATLLDPIGNTPRGTVTNGERIIPLQLPITTQSGNVLATLRFRALLGNDTTTSLILEDPESIGGAVNLSTESGQFRLLGVCPVGTLRLVDGNGQVQILKIRPNPIAESAEIEIEITEAGRTMLTLTDMIGRDVQIVCDQQLPPGRHTLSINTLQLTTGSYFLTLTTPTMRRVQRLDVVR